MPNWFRRNAACIAVGACLGCSPVSTAVKIGARIAGQVISDDETQKLGRPLIGQPASAADAALGPPKDVWNDVSGSASWRTYPVKYDVLDSQRYVVGVQQGRIALVEMVQRHGGEADIPIELVYFAKVKGKSPAECQARLRRSRPAAQPPASWPSSTTPGRSPS